MQQISNSSGLHECSRYSNQEVSLYDAFTHTIDCLYVNLSGNASYVMDIVISYLYALNQR